MAIAPSEHVRNFLKVLGVLAVMAVVAVALAWWHYLRMEPMAPPPLPGTVQAGSLDHDGRSRSWIAYVPAAKTPDPALMLVMHGSLGSGERMRALSRYGFDLLAERYGFIAVYPDGYERHWNDCRGGANYAANLENVDDVGFLRALVRRLVDEQGVDPARVFATGLSNVVNVTLFAADCTTPIPGAITRIISQEAAVTAGTSYCARIGGSALPYQLVMTIE